jgi:hypothetical protein
MPVNRLRIDNVFCSTRFGSLISTVAQTIYASSGVFRLAAEVSALPENDQPGRV